MEITKDNIKAKSISYLSSKPINIAINIAFISTIIGITIDTIGYYNNDLELLALLNAVSAIIIYLSYSLLLLKKLSIQNATSILIYTLISSIYFTSILLFLQDEPQWQLILLRDMFLFIIFITLTVIVLSTKHIIAVVTLFVILDSLLSYLSHPSFVSENELFLMFSIPTFSYGLYLIKKEFINSFNQNIILTEQVNLQKQKLLQQKITAAKDKETKLNETVLLKNKELLSTTILFTQNNATINKVKTLLNSHKAEIDKSIYLELNIALTHSLNNSTSLHWEMFKERFDSLNINFTNSLNKQYPNLSPAEQKLAIFIKIGLSTKEISAILQNTPASIQVSRSRLRKKLNLTLDDNLATFLSKIH